MLDGLVDLLVSAATAVLNTIIAALGAVLAGLVAILPDLPEPPELPEAFTTSASWVAWFFPVDQLLLALAFVVSMWLLWQIVALALRWAKGIS